MGGISIQPMISVNELKNEDNDLLVLSGSDMWMDQQLLHQKVLEEH